MSRFTILAEWHKTQRERIRVTLDEYKGTPTISIREWYEAQPGIVEPGKAGITLSAKHIPKLAEALNHALDTCQD